MGMVYVADPVWETARLPGVRPTAPLAVETQSANRQIETKEDSKLKRDVICRPVELIGVMRSTRHGVRYGRNGLQYLLRNWVRIRNWGKHRRLPEMLGGRARFSGMCLCAQRLVLAGVGVVRPRRCLKGQVQNAGEDSIGLADAQDITILQPEREEELVSTFEQYANGGLHIVDEWLRAQGGDVYGEQAILSALHREGLLGDKPKSVAQAVTDAS